MSKIYVILDKGNIDFDICFSSYEEAKFAANILYNGDYDKSSRRTIKALELKTVSDK